MNIIGLNQIHQRKRQLPLRSPQRPVNPLDVAVEVGICAADFGDVSWTTFRWDTKMGSDPRGADVSLEMNVTKSEKKLDTMSIASKSAGIACRSKKVCLKRSQKVVHVGDG